MVVDDDVLEKEDMYILDRVKEFISSEEVNKFAAAKQLLILIERAVRAVRGVIELSLTWRLSNVVVRRKSK